MEAIKSLPEAGRVPPEVAWGIAVAARACERLEATGRRVHFEIGGADGIAIEVHDLEGRVMSQISGADALGLADPGTVQSNMALASSASRTT